jgi:hypothetical protein
VCSCSGSSYTAGPQDAGVGEGWWAGIVFNREQPTLVHDILTLFSSRIVYSECLDSGKSQLILTLSTTTNRGKFAMGVQQSSSDEFVCHL